MLFYNYLTYFLVNDSNSAFVLFIQHLAVIVFVHLTDVSAASNYSNEQLDEFNYQRRTLGGCEMCEFSFMEDGSCVSNVLKIPERSFRFMQLSSRGRKDAFRLRLCLEISFEHLWFE